MFEAAQDFRIAGQISADQLEGNQAFARDSSVETMAAIVRDEAEPLKVKIPVPLKWLVERCLEKDPTRRFDSSRDLYQQLRVLRDHADNPGLFVGVDVEQSRVWIVRRK